MTSLRPSAPSYDWSDAASYEYLRHIGHAGFMWEWLRRDPGYQIIALGEPPAAKSEPSGFTLLSGEPAAAVSDRGLLFRRSGDHAR